MTETQIYHIELLKAIAPYVVAVFGIISGWIIPCLTKNLELEKHRKQFLYEKKYNAYTQYLNIFDKYWRQSMETVMLLAGFKDDNFKSKEEFEYYKQILLDSYNHFSELHSYLSMPGLKILIFVDNKIENKIKEIVNLDTKKELVLDSESDFLSNAKKVQEYIKILAELASLLRDDLKIGEIN